MWHVYILRSIKTGKYYVGSTSNLNRRLFEHNKGANSSTRGRGSFQIVYTEQFLTRREAYKREIEIKSYKGGNSFKVLLDRAPR